MVCAPPPWRALESISSTEPAGMAMGRPTLDALAAPPFVSPLGSPLGVPLGLPLGVPLGVPSHSTPSKKASMSPRQEVV